MSDKVKRLLIILGAVLLASSIIFAVVFLSGPNRGEVQDIESYVPVVSHEKSVVESNIEPEPALGFLPNVVEISEDFSDFIFNARFLDIPTYEGSGQIVHPQVLHFEEQFLGFYYLMVMSPYPYFDASHENASILGSQDGVSWVVPEGVTNPVVGVPPDVAHGGYFSDPFILRVDDTLELWWRRNVVRDIGNGFFRQDELHNRIYRMTTTDLINWTEREIIFDCEEGLDHFMSPVVFLEDSGKYRVYYTNYNNRMFVVESYNLLEWSEREEVELTLGEWGIWHQEINLINGRFEALFTTLERGDFVFPVHRLFHSYSYDGANFSVGSQIVIENISPELHGMTVHKCSFVLKDGVYQMYFAVYDQSMRWQTFYFEIAKENLSRLFEN